MANDNKLYDSDGREIVLKTDQLCIQFGGLKAVDHVNLEIKKGELYGLIGPNGAGKTTVFNLLTGVYKPTSGRFYLCGEDLTGKPPAEVNKKGIARTFQNIRLFNNLTVIENVMVGLSNQIPCSIFESVFRLPRHRKSEREYYERALELLKVFKLDEYKDHLASNLPYGKQRKLEIARAMATNPTLLLLDEPAAGMNPNETQELMDDITFIRKEFGMTILLIEHDMRLVSGICEKLTVLNFGTELAKGDTAEVLNDPEVIKAYIGE
ncbi:MAG: ABC transporter ATP-binding protein [Clostridia bacterium]|nr:ABC transporter ATP-binding protein [Clostridia bacterium]